jgi:hypothetical protein
VVAIIARESTLRCLAKRPEDRFANMTELQEACDAVLAQVPAEEAATVPYSHPSIAARDDSPTTLRSSVGQSSLSPRPRRVGVWISMSLAAVAAGIVLAVMTTGGEAPASDESTTIAPAMSPVTTPRAAAPPSSPVRDVLTGPPSPAVGSPTVPATPSVSPPVEPTIEPAIEIEPTKAVERVAPKAKTSPRTKKKKPTSTGSLYDDWD